MTEMQHQMAVMRWSQQPSIRKERPELKLLVHIPNGGSRDAIEGRHLKLAGVKKGFPDLELPVARGGYHGLYIELKTGTGTASPEQRWWIEQLNGQGYFAEVCHGWESAVRVLEWYLGLGGDEGRMEFGCARDTEAFGNPCGSGIGPLPPKRGF